jgi:metal-sulfur cluster biosynthetic enzyme
MDPDLAAALRSVIDPELGLNIVDLGLVYKAERSNDAIHVELTMTTPACPLGEMIVQEIKGVLADRFPNVADASVKIVWDPPWSPEKMTGDARKQLGLA